MDIFVQGKIGMQVGPPPTVGQIKEGNPDLDYSSVPIPTKDGSPFTLGVADHLMAFKNDGKKQDAITKFLDYYYTPDVYVPWVKTEGFLPTTKSGAEQLSSEADLKPFLDVLPAGAVLPEHQPQVGRHERGVQEHHRKARPGRRPPESVLKEIQTAADAG